MQIVHTLPMVSHFSLNAPLFIELFSPGNANPCRNIQYRKEVDALSKQNGVKNEMGQKENPSQTRASNTISKEETRSKQRGE
jgi:hypothetical protein